MTACSGFAQYAYAFLQVDADAAEPEARRRESCGARGAAMYDRARGYCLRALAIAASRVRPGCRTMPQAALASMTTADVPALYWTAVAWGGALTLADNPLARLAEVATVRARFSPARCSSTTDGRRARSTRP